MDECGVITGLATYANISAGIGQNSAEQPTLMAQGQPYCSYSASNTPVNGGTYMQQYQWSQCLCSTSGGPSTLKDGTYASICNSESTSCRLPLPAQLRSITHTLPVLAVCQCAVGKYMQSPCDGSHIYLGTEANDDGDGNAVCARQLPRRRSAMLSSAVSCVCVYVCLCLCAACSTCAVGQYISTPCSNIGGMGVSHDTQCASERARHSARPLARRPQ